MKELSIQEKAAAYDKVVEKIKYVMERGVSPVLNKKDLQDIFPQLKESEDEKIRKALIEYFNAYPKDYYGELKTSSILAWLEKQGKQNHTNNVEPKFKIGDFVVDNCGYVWKIEGIINQFYILEGIDGGESRPTIEWVDNTFHHWTIQDAKPGDILVDEDNNIGIYQVKDDADWHSYIYLGCDNHLYGFNIGGYHNIKNTKPATKEQRNKFERAMVDAGYTFDFEKKEWKKIERKPANWSEEDEHRVKDTIYFLDTAKKHYASAVELDACIDWLKLLKDRVQPNQEWSKEDENRFSNLIYLVEHSDEGKGTKKVL